MQKVHRGDWVVPKGCKCDGQLGYVKRVSRSGSWADIEWTIAAREKKWTKRTQVSELIVVTTIPVPMPAAENKENKNVS
jgi:hypothetical protein